MGNSDLDKSPKDGREAKEPKTPTSQEQSSAASGAVVADWSGFQAYSPMPPHGYMASSPQGHPYMWGVQQFIPPYGTPPHSYVAMYPHGGIYAHPTMAPASYPFSPFPMPSPNGVAEASGNTPSNMEVDGKSSEGKEKLPVKRSRGSVSSLNLTAGKNNEPEKTVAMPANGAYSKSADSASEGSSEGCDTDSQTESSRKQQDSVGPSQNGSSQNGGSNQAMAIAAAGIPGPATNLNIGMEYWGAAPSSAFPATPVQGRTGSRDGVQSQHWIQDERELKRQRRKQSNRESARRSRLRKQAECDELAQRAEALKEENASLRVELAHTRSEYERLVAQNASLQERIGESGEEDPRCSR
ncbi:hypothetical protein ACS0TY_021778 [Phlomoides rotata]